MRIPFPERVKLFHALVFAIVLFGVQVLERTNVFYAGCVFMFILLAAVAFNIAGGLPYPSGAYIGFNAMFTVVVPSVAKALLREPADGNLRTPIKMMEVYLVGMLGMLVATMVTRQVRRKNALISNMMPNEALKSAYIGSATFSVLIYLYLAYVASFGNGSFGSFLIQANRYPMLTWVLGVIYTIYRTKGERSLSLPLVGIMLYTALGALFTFSKEQFLSPFFTWAITCAMVGYRLNWTNVVVFFGGLTLTVAILVPYANYGRGVETSMTRPQLSYYLLTHLGEVKEADASAADSHGEIFYYNKHLPLLDRLTILPADDALVDATDRTGSIGLWPLPAAFANVVPHVLYPNKPFYLFGNIYAHELNLLPPDDTQTGVSFSPSAEAYHMARMLGVAFVEPLVLMLVFVVLDSVIGDVRRNAVGLLTTILVSRAAPEGLLTGTPLLIGQYLFTNVLAAYVCAYVLPMLGSIFNKAILLPQANLLQNLTGMRKQTEAQPTATARTL